MENASKALIIAGAILLAILIIGLGMAVFTNARSLIGSQGLDDVEIEAFNSKFESYIGENKRGADVRALCDMVKTSNAASDEDDRQIKLEYKSDKDVTGQSEILSLRNKIKNGSRYDLEASFNPNTKLIDKIVIKDHTTSGTTE